VIATDRRGSSERSGFSFQLFGGGVVSDVDAVIAALRIVLREAEASTNFYWETHIVNKWIYQLPGARWGRWRELRLRPDCEDSAVRPNLITHVRATLAYLETNRETIAAQPSWWPFGRRTTSLAPGAPSAVAKEKPAPPQEQRETPRAPNRSTKPKWLN
jgi:hypothetical protein